MKGFAYYERKAEEPAARVRRKRLRESVRKEKILLRQAERKIIGPGRQAGYLGLPALAAPACPL